VIIRVLGCHGSELTIVDGQGGTYECRTCGFLVNETCMVDAGSVSAGLQEAEQGKIRHVLLSHAHFDHIKGLPLLADNLADDWVPAGYAVKSSCFANSPMVAANLTVS